MAANNIIFDIERYDLEDCVAALLRLRDGNPERWKCEQASVMTEIEGKGKFVITHIPEGSDEQQSAPEAA